MPCCKVMCTPTLTKVASSPFSLGWILGWFPGLVSRVSFPFVQPWSSPHVLFVLSSTKRGTHFSSQEKQCTGSSRDSEHPSELAATVYRGACPIQRALEVSSPRCDSQGAFSCWLCGPFGLRPAIRRSGAHTDRKLHLWTGAVHPVLWTGTLIGLIHSGKRFDCQEGNLPHYRGLCEYCLSVWLWIDHS